MTTPCEQGGNIANLANNISSITAHLADMKESLREQTEIIKSVADQNARIINLEKHEQLYQGHFTEISNRVRSVESSMKDVANEAKEATAELEANFKKKLELRDKQLEPIKKLHINMTSKYAIAVYSSLITLILTGAVCDFLFHKETMDKLMSFLRGY